MPPENHSDTADESAAASAVVEHHARLATGLSTRVQTLLALVDTGSLVKAEKARLDLLEYLREEILPHALVEERVLYPAAAALPEARLLVTGMIEEHRTLAALVQRLSAATSPVRSAATARALEVLFEVHLHKENELIVPLLVAAPDVALGELLAGMHAVLAAMHAAARPGGVLSLDTRLDVRQLPHDERHPQVLSALADLGTGHAVVVVAPHAPEPLLAEIEDRFGDRIRAQRLQSGPDVWQIRLERLA